MIYKIKAMPRKFKNLCRRLRCAFTEHNWQRVGRFVICSKCLEDFILINDNTIYAKRCHEAEGTK